MPLPHAKLRELKSAPVGSAGNRVALAIELSGATTADIARGASLSYTYLSDVARGRFQTVTVANAHKLAEYFGCAIEDLFPAKEAVA